MTTELTVIDRASAVLKFDETKAALLPLVEASARIVNITNGAGYAEAQSARMKLKNTRVEIEKRSKAAREDATAFASAVIAKQKELVGVIAPEEDRLQTLQDKWDAAIALEKAAKANAERLRVEAIHQGIAAIRAIPLRTVGATSQRIAELIDEASRPYSFDPQEFAENAALAKAEVIKSLSVLLEETEAEELRRDCERVEREKEAARIAAERAELARLRAEQEKRDAEERAKIAAEREAARKAQEEADRKATAEREAIAAAERAKQAEELRMQRAAEDKARAERQAKEDAERAERERVAAEAAERQRIESERIQREREHLEQAKAEQERIARQREIDSATLIDAATEAHALLTRLAPLHITTAKLGSAIDRHTQPETLKVAA